MEPLSQEVQNLVKKIAEDNGLVRFTVKVTKSVAKDGDGYIGVLEGLSLTDTDSNKTLSLVIKRAPASANLRKQFPTRICFLREVFMYQDLFPEFIKFQEKHNIPNPFKNIPTFYGSITDDFKETLILENLKDAGFTLCNRQEPMNSNHLNSVLTHYARLHAISHAMKRHSPEKFKKLTQSISTNVMADFHKDDSPENQMPSDGMEAFFSPTLETVKDKPKLVEAVERFQESAALIFFTTVAQRREYDVVVHGDCWSANMMFKYENTKNTKKPTELILIDWQLSTIGNPLFDVVYFLCISAGKNDLENYEEYCQTYHMALDESLAAFGLDVGEIYPYSTLIEDWNLYVKVGFFMALIMMQQTLSEKKTHDFAELADQGHNIHDMGTRKHEVTDLFRQRMGDLVEFLTEHEFI